MHSSDLATSGNIDFPWLVFVMFSGRVDLTHQISETLGAKSHQSRLRLAPNYLLLGMVQVSTWAYSICTLTRLFGKKDRIHQANPNNINRPLSTVFWPRFPQADVGKWMANAIEWGCPSIHLLGVLYLPLLPSIPSRKSRKCYRCGMSEGPFISFRAMSLHFTRPKPSLGKPDKILSTSPKVTASPKPCRISCGNSTSPPKKGKTLVF